MADTVETRNLRQAWFSSIKWILSKQNTCTEYLDACEDFPRYIID